MADTRELENTRDIDKYNINPTMQIISKQSVGICAAAADDINAVIDANAQAGTKDMYSIFYDLFILGTIYGKKAERAEKNGTDITPIAQEPIKEE